jgi:ribose 5-phosphate isomerase A
MSIDDLKKAAAEKAVEQVKSGMALGLGSGSTSHYAITRIGELLQAGQLTDIVGVPTSQKTAETARAYNIPLTTLGDCLSLDLVIDGADEVDPQLNLIKGLGGAMLREKMVAAVARRVIIVVDQRKLVDKLGTRSPLPIEVVQFGWKLQALWLENLGCTPALRGGEAEPFITDNGNYILDCTFPNGIDHPFELATTLTERIGVVEHGLFLGMTSQVIVADPSGIRFLT